MRCTTLPIRLPVCDAHFVCQLCFVLISSTGLTDESEDSGDDDDDDKRSNVDRNEDEGADEDEDLQEFSVRAPTFTNIISIVYPEFNIGRLTIVHLLQMRR